MSLTHHNELLECPECGTHTHELYHAKFTKYGEEVLMCDACYGGSEQQALNYEHGAVDLELDDNHYRE